ncbi:FxsB family cyclophane-forming radical SAM/SPASM peptide maturase [Phytohabitans houttuyneae]|uniref:Radical SAM core domain-containing protein n=1 Tax=Phytohabitans houttuyneae TaxID=1076126 RepID=A0A6V8KFH9_9ACTN|nr:FxsB family cyclophane-forming radical SAM/SPASM peptide maturase [Phytohabitans houttuyneae]GFJ80457.1 hypothetical protein Phou_046370 [Phytohabitans houttuyneae]
MLKVHSRCDLACDHCYIYEHADQTWRGRPRVMSPKTVRASAYAIADHAMAHSLPAATVVLHGGEPLLVGPRRLREMLSVLREVISPVTALDLRMQSNGISLTPELCDLLAQFQVSVGISLDGDRAANDLHRRYANGASSHDRVLSALWLLRRGEHRHIYGGLLCTVDLRADPLRVYAALREQEPPRVDFLLPHATWDSPPPTGATATPYAAWLGAIYEQWLRDGRPIPIRLFDSLRSLVAGGPSLTEWVGLDSVDLAVIETDGSWEQVDSLKTAYHGAAATGLDVFRHSADAAASHPMIAQRQAGIAALCATCRACPVVRQCGGGLLAHRYRSGSGFDNPSVYCADLKELITNVSGTSSVASGESADGYGEVATEVLDDLGSGYGAADVLDALHTAELSMSRMLVAQVYEDLASGGWDGADLADTVQSAWHLVQRLDSTAPHGLHRVLGHPYVRSWAIECLRSRPAGERSDALGPGYLANVAAAAAIAADVPAELPVPVHNGVLHLPTIGTMVLDWGTTDTALVATRPGGFQVRGDGEAYSVGLGADEPAAGWQPTRQLDFAGRALLLDDTDPFRHGLGWPPADRISSAEAGRLQSLLIEARESVASEVPQYAVSLDVTMQTITPLAADPSGRLRSGSKRDAYGAVGIGPVPDADALAVLLVHEVQHLKFGALVDVYDLVDHSRRAFVRVGWRSDPRPVEAALTGTYAHLAVAEIWRARADRTAAAAGNYLRYRQWITSALAAVERSGALTESGRRFVIAMRQTIASWGRSNHRNS